MFNTRITNNHYSPDKIIEQRAPTDNSVRLLREMEEAARKQVMAVCNNENNSFHFTQTVMMSSLGDGYTVYSSFTLNGEEYEIKSNLSELDLNCSLDKRKLADRMLKTFSEAIAEKLVISMILKPL